MIGRPAVPLLGRPRIQTTTRLLRPRGHGGLEGRPLGSGLGALAFSDAAGAAQLAQQQLLGQALGGEQGRAATGLLEQGQEQVGPIQPAGAPASPAAVGRFQQVFEGITNEQLGAGAAGLVGAKRIEPIEQALGLQRQGIDPGAIARITEQHLHQVLHIHLAMAPAPGLVLAGEQQLPGQLTEAIRFGGEAAAARIGAGVAPGVARGSQS